MVDANLLAFYARHGALTEPGGQAEQFADLSTDLAGLCRFTQGIVIHADWASAYGISGELSRQTLPVAERLSAARGASQRTSGTCRDFALMLCSILRHRGTPARVRCGFATYFTANPFEDHWVCEYWKPDERRWAQADAQLDRLQCDHLHIAFDTTDLPRGKFVNAGEAWTACRNSKAGANDFGHGGAVGAWFMRVNLMRDLLALQKREVSNWDDWRAAPAEAKVLREDQLAACDRIAEVTRTPDARILQLTPSDAPCPTS
jgi:hypothetical protein